MSSRSHSIEQPSGRSTRRWFGQIACVRANQNAERPVRTRPLSGITVGCTKSNVEMRSVATSKSRSASSAYRSRTFPLPRRTASVMTLSSCSARNAAESDSHRPGRGRQDQRSRGSPGGATVVTTARAALWYRGRRQEGGVQIGLDIGGTFTDIVALDRDGRLALTKVPSTPKDLLDGIGTAVRSILAIAGAKPGDVERFIHGTTVATNAILEQKGAVTAVLTTEGFEDVLELGRMKRSRMYDLAMDPETPTFLAPRRRRVGIRERLDAKGRVLIPLNDDEVRESVQALRAQGVSAIAVCYLFSFVNPVHERRTRDIITALAPEIIVSLSSEVDPTFREYERLCVTAFDAYLGPVVKRYLAGLADALRGLGVAAPPLIMRSRGGIVSAALAAREPVTLFLSGPAGGVMGARFAAERSGVRDFVSLDMGGTSNDVGVGRDGAPVLAGQGSMGP